MNLFPLSYKMQCSASRASSKPFQEIHCQANRALRKGLLTRKGSTPLISWCDWLALLWCDSQHGLISQRHKEPVNQERRRNQQPDQGAACIPLAEIERG